MVACRGQPPLPAAGEIIRTHRKDLDDLAEQVRLKHEQRLIDREDEEKQRQEENRVERELHDAELREMFRKMSPAAREDWNRRIQIILDGLRTKRYGLHNIGELIKQATE